MRHRKTLFFLFTLVPFFSLTGCAEHRSDLKNRFYSFELRKIYSTETSETIKIDYKDAGKKENMIFVSRRTFLSIENVKHVYNQKNIITIELDKEGKEFFYQRCLQGENYGIFLNGELLELSDHINYSDDKEIVIKGFKIESFFAE